MKNPIRIIIDEVKKDIQTIKGIKTGEVRLIRWSELDFAGALKSYWPWFLLLIAAFLAGLFFGSILAHNHYVEVIEDKCPQAFINNESVQQQTRLNLDYEEWQNQKKELPTNALDVKQLSK